MSTDYNPPIKHIVISSGGPAGHMMYSILRTLNLKGVWDIKDIKSIYGSSIGSFIAIIIALRYEWEVMDDYLIKRPWEKIFLSSASSSSSSSSLSGTGETTEHSSSSSASSASASLSDAKNKLDYVFKLYKNHGLYGLKEFTETLRPALQGKDFGVDVTFQEFYERTGIELHFTVTELNKFQAIDFSHKTHPKQGLVEACYMSCCYPFGFTPIYRDGCCYIDGGIINDYPVNECIRDQKCDVAEILGVKMLWERKPANLTDKSSVLQFISTFFNQIKGNLFENRPTKPIPNEVVCVSKVFASQDWMNWMKDENYRRELVLRGETFANVFMSYRRNFRESAPTAAPAAPAAPAVLHTTPALEPVTTPTLPESVAELDNTNTNTNNNVNTDTPEDESITMM
jgi:predicted acylesterase/phospholipase RssA